MKGKLFKFKVSFNRQYAPLIAAIVAEISTYVGTETPEIVNVDRVLKDQYFLHQFVEHFQVDFKLRPITTHSEPVNSKTANSKGCPGKVL